MEAGFPVTVMPGIRVRTSSRGVQATIGLRPTRDLFGADREAFGTGAGPILHNTARGDPARSAPNAIGGTAALNRRLTEIRYADTPEPPPPASAEAIAAVLDLPKTEYTPATRPIANGPPPADAASVHSRHLKQARASARITDRSARERAVQDAGHRADAEVRTADETYQAALDAHWNALVSNEPDAVSGALAATFEGSDDATAAVGVAGSEATLVAVVPPVAGLPELRTRSPLADHRLLETMTRRKTEDLYKLLVCGQALVAVKAALASAPGLTGVRVAVVRPSDVDGRRIEPEVILAGHFERARFTGIDWSGADAITIINDINTDLILGDDPAMAELTAIDLTREPDLAALAATVEFVGLLGTY